MLIFHILIAAIFLAANPASTIKGEDPARNTFVTFRATVAEKRVAPGDTATIRFTLQPAKGIHINLDPPMNLELDSLPVVSSHGKLILPHDTSTGYLDLRTPVSVSLKLSKSLKAGKHPLKGVLTYYFCSDAQGWCRKFKQPFEVFVTVGR